MKTKESKRLYDQEKRKLQQRQLFLGTHALNFFKLYMGDYQRDTGALSIAEHGAYFLMLQYHYATEKPLPKGKDLYRLLRCESKADRDAVDVVAARFWRERDDGWINKRASEEIAKADHQRTVNAAVGKLGGRPKLTERKPNDNRIGLLEKPNDNPSHSQTPERTKSKTKAPAKARATPIPEGFGISDRVQEWASANEHTRLEERLEHFKGYVLANGKAYTDWDQAFMNAIRDNWAKLQPNRVTPNAPASKTASALMSLEGMKHEPSGIQHGNSERSAETPRTLPAKHTAS